MRTPSKRAAKGFDVVVWVDGDGDIVAKGFSDAGHDALRQYVSDYRKGDIVEIYVDPDQFTKDVGENILVGALDGQGKVVAMDKLRLH
jgi:hypothetical protein